MARGAFWTIIVDDQPTAFRAPVREDLLPTLKQLHRQHPTAVIKWFQRGGCGRPPATRWMPASRPAAAPGWRPGGAHKDPRDQYKVPRDVKRARWASQAADGRGPWMKGDKPFNAERRTAPSTGTGHREPGTGGRPPRADRPRVTGRRGSRRATARERRTPAREAQGGGGSRTTSSTGTGHREPGTGGRPPRADRPTGDRPAWKPKGDRPIGDRPAWKPNGDGPPATRAKPAWKPKGDGHATRGERPAWKPRGDRPTGSTAWKPKAMAPAPAATNRWKPNADRATGDRPAWKPKGDGPSRRAARSPHGSRRAIGQRVIGRRGSQKATARRRPAGRPAWKPKADRPRVTGPAWKPKGDGPSRRAARGPHGSRRAIGPRAIGPRGSQRPTARPGTGPPGSRRATGQRGDRPAWKPKGGRPRDRQSTGYRGAGTGGGDRPPQQRAARRLAGRPPGPRCDSAGRWPGTAACEEDAHVACRRSAAGGSQEEEER